MSFNQKMLLGITILATAITGAIAFVLFEPPYSRNFLIEVGAVIFAEVFAGMTLVAKFGKDKAVFPFSLGVMPVTLIYFLFVLFMALFTGCETKTFVMWHGVGFALTIICCMVFRMGERHVEAQSKDDPPAQKIERAETTWR